jgi:hypothetical protein
MDRDHFFPPFVPLVWVAVFENVPVKLSECPILQQWQIPD